MAKTGQTRKIAGLLFKHIHQLREEKKITRRKIVRLMVRRLRLKTNNLLRIIRLRVSPMRFQIVISRDSIPLNAKHLVLRSLRNCV